MLLFIYVCFSFPIFATDFNSSPDQGVSYERKQGITFSLFGRKKVTVGKTLFINPGLIGKVSVDDHQSLAQNTQDQSQKNSRAIFSGQPLPRPRLIPVRNASGLSGGMTELSPGAKIYVTVRHLFQASKNAKQTLDASLREAGLNPADYRITEFGPIGDEIDVLLISPRAKSAAWALGKIDKRCARADESSLYYSPQFGGGKLGRDFQFSSGKLLGIVTVNGVTHYHLNFGDAGNLTGPGSSGAAVFFRSENQQWKFGAILQAYQKGIAARAFPLSDLSRYPSRDADLGKIGNEPITAENGWIPISRRGGGGI